MAQTITLLAHGATRESEARFRLPSSSRDAMYFISPAYPAAIHSEKCSSSRESVAGAIPARSNPAPVAALFTMDSRPDMETVTGTSKRGARKGQLHAEFFHFFVVILAVENIPLLRAFENGPLLGIDLLARGGVDPCFLIQKILKNFARFLAACVGIFDEFNLVHLLQDVGNGAGEHVNFVAAESHRTALYLRTSSVFTLRNIS